MHCTCWWPRTAQCWYRGQRIYSELSLGGLVTWKQLIHLYKYQWVVSSLMQSFVVYWTPGTCVSAKLLSNGTIKSIYQRKLTKHCPSSSWHYCTLVVTCQLLHWYLGVFPSQSAKYLSPITMYEEPKDVHDTSFQKWVIVSVTQCRTNHSASTYFCCVLSSPRGHPKINTIVHVMLWTRNWSSLEVEDTSPQWIGMCVFKWNRSFRNVGWSSATDCRCKWHYQSHKCRPTVCTQIVCPTQTFAIFKIQGL